MIAGYDSVKEQPSWAEMRGMKIGPLQAVLPDGLIMANNTFRRNIVCALGPTSKLMSLRGTPMTGNVWDSNLYWAEGNRFRISFADTAGDCDWECWTKLGGDPHSVLKDPLFVNLAASDFCLRSNSPATDVGFKPIPIERIGPYKDGFRATWPIVEAEGVRERPLRPSVNTGR